MEHAKLEQQLLTQVAEKAALEQIDSLIEMVHRQDQSQPAVVMGGKVGPFSSSKDKK